MKQSTFPRSGVLILAPNSIRSLLPSTLISQVESLLESHRIDVAANLAEQQHKRIHGKASANGDEVRIHSTRRCVTINVLNYIFRRMNYTMSINDWVFNVSRKQCLKTPANTSFVAILILVSWSVITPSFEARS